MVRATHYTKLCSAEWFSTSLFVSSSKHHPIPFHPIPIPSATTTAPAPASDRSSIQVRINQARPEKGRRKTWPPQHATGQSFPDGNFKFPLELVKRSRVSLAVHVVRRRLPFQSSTAVSLSLACCLASARQPEHAASLPFPSLPYPSYPSYPPPPPTFFPSALSPILARVRRAE